MAGYIKDQYFIKASPGNGWAILGIILFRVTADLVYKFFISGPFNYQGMYYSFDSGRYIASWAVIIAALPFILYFFRRDRVSDVIVSLMFLLAFIPVTSMHAFRNADFFLWYCVYWLVLFLLQRWLPNFSIRRIEGLISNVVFWGVVIAFSVSVLFIWGRYTDFRIHLDLVDVYGIRMEARGYGLPTILSYIYSMSSSVTPLLIILALHWRKKLLGLGLAFVQFASFCIEGAKYDVFLLAASLIGYYFYSLRDNRTKQLSWGLTGVNILSALEALILGSRNIIYVFIRRVYYVPTTLNYEYFSFFSQNEHDFFRQSILRRLGFESPYAMRIQRIIGEQYTGSYETNANNGLFSDAYANLGLAGIIIMPILIILLLRVIDACAEGLPRRLLIPVIISVAINLISGSFFAGLLSHGNMVLCIILYVMPRKAPGRREKGQA